MVLLSTAASPWTITHRPFENNVHKVTYAALPLLLLLRLADPGLFGVALGVAFLFGSLMSNVRVDETRDSKQQIYICAAHDVRLLVAGFMLRERRRPPVHVEAIIRGVGDLLLPGLLAVSVSSWAFSCRKRPFDSDDEYIVELKSGRNRVGWMPSRRQRAFCSVIFLSAHVLFSSSASIV